MPAIDIYIYIYVRGGDNGGKRLALGSWQRTDGQFQQLRREWTGNNMSEAKAPNCLDTMPRELLTFCSNSRSTLHQRQSSAAHSRWRWVDCLVESRIFEACSNLNEIPELYPYPKILRVPHTGSYAIFKQNFCIAGSNVCNQRLHSFLDQILTRKTYKSQLFELPIIEMPATHQETITLEFKPVDRKIYDIIHKRFIRFLRRAYKSQLCNRVQSRRPDCLSRACRRRRRGMLLVMDQTGDKDGDTITTTMDLHHLHVNRMDKSIRVGGLHVERLVHILSNLYQTSHFLAAKATKSP